MKITREEYLRLLATAKEINKEREYLFVKAFALVGLKMSEVPDFTIELIKEGVVPYEPTRRYLAERRIPESFQKELLDYAERKNIKEGPIFITRTGKLVERTKITSNLKVLCAGSNVQSEKVTPRELRNLYFETVDEVHREMVDQMTEKYLKLVEAE